MVHELSRFRRGRLFGAVDVLLVSTVMLNKAEWTCNLVSTQLSAVSVNEGP